MSERKPGSVEGPQWVESQPLAGRYGSTPLAAIILPTAIHSSLNQYLFVVRKDLEYLTKSRKPLQSE